MAWTIHTLLLPVSPKIQLLQQNPTKQSPAQLSSTLPELHYSSSLSSGTKAPLVNPESKSATGL